MSYWSIHRWVEKELGKPHACEFCGTADERQYHWSNKSGEYKKDLRDWQRLCVPCHKTYDYSLRVSKGLPRKKLKEECKNGHKLTGSNIRIRIVRGLPNRVCVECQREYLRTFRRKPELKKT